LWSGKLVISINRAYNIQLFLSWEQFTFLEYFGVFRVRQTSSTTGAMEGSMFLIASESSSLDFYGFWANFWFVNPYSALSQDDQSRPWGWQL